VKSDDWYYRVMEATHMNKLQKAQKEVARLWALMCAEEGVPVDSKFIVFSPTNKFAVPYNNAVKKLFRKRACPNYNLYTVVR
jgi:hypothetical protein